MTRRSLASTGRVEIEPGQRLHRAKCSLRGCPTPGWTVYPVARYPDRHFDLDVVAPAVAESAFGRDDAGRATAFAAIGRRYSCSGRSVSRWTGWLAEAADIAALAGECARIDPAGMPVAVRPNSSDSRAGAGRALAVFDRLAALLEQRGILPAGPQPSLVRILDDQRVRHGVRFPVRNLSPPLSARTAKTAPHAGCATPRRQ